MTEKHFIVATAGHVDHGKSALVKALTGTDPDRLPEEKARGITIDLGFAELILAGTGPGKLHAAIVDVPGHEAFVRSMIAGVGSIDLALLVVAADDGWMPQTEEHLQILTYLGVNRAVVALSKSDLGNAEKAGAEIRDQLRDTAFASSPIIATSVRSGEGLEELRRALADQLSSLESQPNIGKPRLFVDRVFALHGIGTVVTGTLTGGTLHRGQEVVVQPRNAQARIRSIQTHGRNVEAAQPGMRTAINLPDLTIDTSAAGIARGDVLADAGFEPIVTLDVVLEKSARLRQKDRAARPLKSGASVYLHHGTARVSAKVVFLEDRALNVGERLIAQLRLDSPVLAFLGDRFVIRDPSEQHTIAGGRVLDADGDRGNFRSASQRKLLVARAAVNGDVDLNVHSEIIRHGPLQSSALLRKSRFSAEEIDDTLRRLQARKQIRVWQDIAADVETWRSLRSRAVEIIDNAHKKNPERPGVDVNELRMVSPNQAVFDSLLSDLCTDEFVRNGSIISRRSHQSVLPPDLAAIAEKIRHVLSIKPFDPPARKQIAPDAPTRQALAFMIEQGEAIEIGSDAILSGEAFTQMKTTTVAFLQKHGTAAVSQLRQELQTSRRIMVPMLELLDAQKVTRRAGDKRVLA